MAPRIALFPLLAGCAPALEDTADAFAAEDKAVAAAVQGGDANLDGKVNLSDAQGILNYLYKGAAAPRCMAAADADGSGMLDMSDALRILNWLYSGGPAPTPLGTWSGDLLVDSNTIPPYFAVTDGDLYVRGNQVTTLDGINCIQSVTGVVDIQYTAIQSASMPLLSQVRSIVVDGNPSMVGMDFPLVTSLEALWISWNDHLVDLDGFGGLTHLGSDDSIIDYYVKANCRITDDDARNLALATDLLSAPNAWMEVSGNGACR